MSNPLFQFNEGFGMSSVEELAALQKALYAGYEVNPLAMTDGAAIRAEDVDNTLHITTYRDEHFRIWNDIAKIPAYSTAEQYIRLTGYGTAEGGFMGEGSLPNETTSQLERMVAFVKYIGTRRRVTHPMMMARTYATDPVTMENRNGAMVIARQLEWSMFYGNSKLGHEVGGKPSEGLEFDGLWNFAEVEVDMRNKPLTERAVNSIAQVVLDNYGMPNQMYLDYAVWQDLNTTFFPKEKVLLPTNDGEYTAGVKIGSMVTQAGTIRVSPAFFLQSTDLRSPLRECPLVNTNVDVPLPPSAVTIGTPTGSDGDFVKSFPSGGTVSYKVTACNFNGESAGVTGDVDVTLTSSDVTKHIPITIANAASPTTNNVEYYNIYRKDDNTGGKYYWIAAVPCQDQTGSGATVWNDTNSVMPGTRVAFLGEMNPDIIHFRQLSPLMKIDLAQIDTSYRWALVIYGVMVLTTPRKWVKVKNIGRLVA